MFVDGHDVQLASFGEEEQLFLLVDPKQNSKKMKLNNARIFDRQVRFQEPDADTVVHFDRLPQDDLASLWYGQNELKAIHKEIFVSLMESKTGCLRDFEFSTRGLEEIRKRKPHKRQVRRKEYLAAVVALSREQRRELGAQGHPEELKDFAVAQSRSAVLRAQHYAALDAEEARAVYQETFHALNTLKSVPPPPRRGLCPHSPALSTSSVDSIARSA